MNERHEFWSWIVFTLMLRYQKVGPMGGIFKIEKKRPKEKKWVQKNSEYCKYLYHS